MKTQKLFWIKQRRMTQVRQLVFDIVEKEPFSNVAHNSTFFFAPTRPLALFKHSSESLDSRDTHKRWHVRVRNRLTNEDSHNPLAQA